MTDEKKAQKSLCVYKNELNKQNLSSLSAWDLNVFFSLIFLVANRGTDELTYEFRELRKTMHFNKSQSNRKFATVLDGLANRLGAITYYYDDGRIEKFWFFDRWMIDPKKKIVKIKVSSLFVTLVNKLDAKFTEMELEPFLALKSKHAKNLLRLLFQYRETGLLIVRIEDIKEKLGSEKKENKIFIRDVVKPALEEIAKTNCFNGLEMTLKRKTSERGKPISQLIIKFQPKPYSKKKPVPTPKKKPNQFHYNDERHYDTDDLEKMVQDEMFRLRNELKR